MKVLISKYLGFCNGVKNAYQLAVKTASKGEPTYILGYLVHNQNVIDELQQKGVVTLKTLKDLPRLRPDDSGGQAKDAKGYLIISAHGVSPDVQKKAALSGLTVIDTTCPWVKKPQELAKKMAEEGYHVIIVGDKNHAEVIGIMGWAKGKAEVVENLKEAKKIGNYDKIAVIAQTTQARRNFDEVINELSGKTQELRVCDTICDATGKMQRAAVDVARRCEVMLVIGDKKSANTRRLKELCEDTGAKTYQIGSAEDLNLNWLKGFDIIGVTAGASTPNEVIDTVLAKLNSA